MTISFTTLRGRSGELALRLVTPNNENANVLYSSNVKKIKNLSNKLVTFGISLTQIFGVRWLKTFLRRVIPDLMMK